MNLEAMREGWLDWKWEAMTDLRAKGSLTANGSLEGPISLFLFLLRFVCEEGLFAADPFSSIVEGELMVGLLKRRI